MFLEYIRKVFTRGLSRNIINVSIIHYLNKYCKIITSKFIFCNAWGNFVLKNKFFKSFNFMFSEILYVYIIVRVFMYLCVFCTYICQV